MTSVQKVIKCCAFGLACLLAFSIISGIVAAGFGILTAVGVVSGGSVETINCESYARCLNLELGYTDVEVKVGEEFLVETEDKDFEVTKTDDKIVIKDKKRGGWFIWHNDRKIVVTLPRGAEFDAVGIGSGGGKIEIEEINTHELELTLGAGETTIKNISVDRKAKVSTGAGRLVIEGGKINNAEIDLGVGETSIRAAIIGDNKIDAGVGAVKLDLLLPESEYAIKVEKGIGEVKFNGSSVASGSTIGNGENRLEVNGGVGEIGIKTALLDETD